VKEGGDESGELKGLLKGNKVNIMDWVLIGYCYEDLKI